MKPGMTDPRWPTVRRLLLSRGQPLELRPDQLRAVRQIAQSREFALQAEPVKH